jgi:hypothetical protein
MGRGIWKKECQGQFDQNIYKHTHTYIHVCMHGTYHMKPLGTIRIRQ